jgi:hypothetical protein
LNRPEWIEELYASSDCTGDPASTNRYDVDVCESTVDGDDIEYSMRHCSTDILFDDDPVFGGDDDDDGDEGDDDSAATAGSSLAAALIAMLGAYALVERA